jgi:hypothetical protein
MTGFDFMNYCEKYRNTRSRLVGLYNRLSDLANEKESLEREIESTNQEVRDMQHILTASIESGEGPTEIILKRTEPNHSFRTMSLWVRISNPFAKKEPKLDDPSEVTYHVKGPFIQGQLFVYDGYTITRI